MNKRNSKSNRTRIRQWGMSLVLVSMGIAAPMVQAESPTEFDVEGTTISFNFPDWYQVQNAVTYQSICEGNDDCTAEPGDYFVINLTTGERFEITIDGIDMPMPVEGDFDLTGNVVTFNVPDWFQIQRRDNYQSVCEGNSDCTLEPGDYVVINHSTGVRTDITVPGGELPIPVDGDFNINGNTVTFIEPGWFQIQRQDNYQTVCEGFGPCVVDNGLYQVINLTTGERWMDVTVDGDSDNDAVINADNYRDIVKQAFEVYSGQAFDDRLSLFPYFLNSDVTGNSRIPLTLDCDNGGTHDQNLLLTPASRNSMNASYSDCLWSNGTIGNGDTLNGSIEDEFNPGGHARTFSNFTSSNGTQFEMEVDGLHKTACCGRIGNMVGGVVMETENLDYLFTFPLGTLQVSDSTTNFSRAFDSGILEGSFTMQADVTGLEDVMVETEQALTYNTDSLVGQGDTGYLWAFTSGVLKLTAPSDGSSVTIDASTGDFNTVSVLISSGTESVSVVDTWSDWRESLACTRERCERFSNLPAADIPSVDYR